LVLKHTSLLYGLGAWIELEEAFILIDLTLVILFAKLFEEAMTRIRQPPLLGDLLAGMIIGPTVLGLIRATHNVEAIGWLGVVILIFLAGLESSIEDLKKYGIQAIVVALGGVVATFSLAFLVSSYLGYGFATSLFVAVILAPTSVSVTVATLMNLGMIRSRVGEIVIGAAVADDIYAMVLFGLTHSLVIEESISPTSLYPMAIGLVFVLAVFLLLYKYSDAIVGGIARKSRLMDAPHSQVLIIGLATATITAYFRLSPLIGAYFAGLALSPVVRGHRLEHFYTLLVNFISPFFFVYAGILLDPWSILASIELSKAIVVTTLIVLAGVLGKVVGCGLAAKLSGLNTRDSLAIGVAMMPRAGVDLVIAVTGLTLGILTMELYFAALVLIYVTSILTPALIKHLLKA